MTLTETHCPEIHRAMRYLEARRRDEGDRLAWWLLWDAAMVAICEKAKPEYLKSRLAMLKLWSKPFEMS